MFGEGPIEQLKASDIAAVNIAIRELRKEYMEYWNTTTELTSTGRPIDAVICPVAPFPAARPEQYHYYGYTVWVNVLDYTAVVIPVTTVDKEVDKTDSSFEPANETDRAVHESCECFSAGVPYADLHSDCSPDDPKIYDGAHVSLQLVGRRLEEEKMLAIAEHVAFALER